MSAVQRLIDEMKRRNYAAKTTKEYAGCVRRLGAHFGCCPSTLTPEQIREYQLHLIQQKHVSWSYYNSTVSAFRFLYLQALRRDWSIEHLPYGRRGRQLPVILSRQEVFQLWRPLYRPKRRLLLMTAYSAALRVSELVQLRVEDLDPVRMLIHIRPDKRRRERWVPYSPTLKQRLELYLAEHDSPWLFCGASTERPLSAWAARDICVQAARLSRLDKPITLYTLRHSAVTHLLEMGVDPRTMQQILGHGRLSSTLRYTLLSYQDRQRQVDPLDLLPREPRDDDTTPPTDA